MTERPILFSAPMVRSLLAGIKTQTRRTVKPDVAEGLDFMGGDGTEPDDVGVDIRWGEMQYDDSHDSGVPQWLACCRDYPEEGFIEIGKPFGAIGDRLWVRETWAAGKCADGLAPSMLHPGTWTGDNGGLWFPADGTEPRHAISPRGKTRVSIHMPRWASRIALEVTGVRVERLNDIDEQDALAEGITCREVIVDTRYEGGGHREIWG